MNVTLSLNATVKQYSFSSQQWSEPKTILDKIQHDNYNHKYCAQTILIRLYDALHDTVRNILKFLLVLTHNN